MRAARTRRGCHHVERTFALGRPELGFTTTVWIRFFPSARESKRRYHDDACAPPPIHPFPPGHFHSALARSLPARRHGALHEQSRSSSHIVPETPENPHDFRPILAPPPCAAPFPNLLQSFFPLTFPFFSNFIAGLERWSVVDALDTCSGNVGQRGCFVTPHRSGKAPAFHDFNRKTASCRSCVTHLYSLIISFF